MLKKILLGVSALAITGIVLHLLTCTEKNSWQEFQNFKLKYKKSYGTHAELEYRYSVFQQTLVRIAEVNSDQSKRYTLAVNQFADLKFAEFKAKYLNSALQKSSQVKPAEDDRMYTEFKQLSTRPKKFNWRDIAGAVGPVKNQGQAGDCWAFSTVASMENAVWRKSSTSVSLSEQELIDCAKAEYEQSALSKHNGGFLPDTFGYIKRNKLATEQAYPFRGYTGQCDQNNIRKPGRIAIESYTRISPVTVQGLLDAVAVGVTAVLVEVQADFMSYTSGVYHASSDCGKALNHAVAVVGYDTDSADPYFVVRNSWGADWGQSGYINMAVGGESGTCGIANAADAYPNL